MGDRGTPTHARARDAKGEMKAIKMAPRPPRGRCRGSADPGVEKSGRLSGPAPRRPGPGGRADPAGAAPSPPPRAPGARAGTPRPAGPAPWHVRAGRARRAGLARSPRTRGRGAGAFGGRRGWALGGLRASLPPRSGPISREVRPRPRRAPRPAGSRPPPAAPQPDFRRRPLLPASHSPGQRPAGSYSRSGLGVRGPRVPPRLPVLLARAPAPAARSDGVPGRTEGTRAVRVGSLGRHGRPPRTGPPALLSHANRPAGKLRYRPYDHGEAATGSAPSVGAGGKAPEVVGPGPGHGAESCLPDPSLHSFIRPQTSLYLPKPKLSSYQEKSECTPHPAGRRREAPRRGCCPRGPSRDAPAPSPSPDQLPDAALAEATALAPWPPLPSLPETQQAAALTDREGGRGPARQRRGWGGCGDSGSAAPDEARSRAQARLRPLSRRPCLGGRTAESRGRRARKRRCGGSRRRAASRGSERLPAPPSRAGTARSDVSAAPPAPLPSLRPLHPGSRGAIQAFAAPHPHPRALPGSSRATDNLGGGGEPRRPIEAPAKPGAGGPPPVLSTPALSCLFWMPQQSHRMLVHKRRSARCPTAPSGGRSREMQAHRTQAEAVWNELLPGAYLKAWGSHLRSGIISASPVMVFRFQSAPAGRSGTQTGSCCCQRGGLVGGGHTPPRGCVGRAEGDATPSACGPQPRPGKHRTDRGFRRVRPGGGRVAERRRSPSLSSQGAGPGAGRRLVPGRTAAPPGTGTGGRPGARGRRSPQGALGGPGRSPGVGGGPGGRRRALRVRILGLAPGGASPSGRGSRGNVSHRLPSERGAEGRASRLARPLCHPNSGPV
ncbi:collagen alpha-1(I) chain-like [Hyaena hyaena]|uniref:collagen alpha-1(I) chain-like n=1 Tax=Hyaena hyaena TaxID=95912 RepID=UPI001924AE90|nr:collagen alpha-1(I) chain-like [Hyaena hyaena]